MSVSYHRHHSVIGLIGSLVLTCLVGQAGHAAVTTPAQLTPTDRAQVALYLLEQTLKNPCQYNIERTCEMTAPGQQEAVRAALQGLAAQRRRAGAQLTLPAGGGLGHATLVEGNGRVDIEILPDGLTASRTLRLGLKPSKHSLVFTNLAQILDTLMQLRAVVAAPATTAVTNQTARQVTAPPATMWSRHLFVSQAFRDDIKIFDVEASRDNFEQDLLSGPIGVSALQCREGIFSFIDRSWDVVLLADGNWNRLLYAGLADDKFVQAAGHYGSGALQFKRPVAIDANPNHIYVADRYNNRVQVLNYDGSASLSYHQSITGLSEPVDVAAAVIPKRDGTDGLTNEVAVLDYEGTIKVYQGDVYSLPVYQYAASDWGTAPLVCPTAICYGRHITDNDYIAQVYVIDSGNSRIVSRQTGKTEVMETPQGTFPPGARLSAIDADDFGNLYVTDARYNSIYVLPPTLDECIAWYGITGRGVDSLWIPQAIAHQFGWKDSSGTPVPLPLGMFIVCEPFGSHTGVKKLKLDVDVDSLTDVYHHGQGGNTSSDYVEISWKQSGPGRATVQAFGHLVTTKLCMPGIQTVRYYPGSDFAADASMEGWIEVSVRSPYPLEIPFYPDSVEARTQGYVTQVDRYFSTSGNFARVVNPTMSTWDTATGLAAPYAYGWPKKWWKIRLAYDDQCPVGSTPVRYWWRSTSTDGLALTDSTSFSPDPFASAPIVDSSLVTDSPFVWARFHQHINADQARPAILGRVWLFQGTDSNKRPLDSCLGNLPSPPPDEEVILIPKWDVFDIALPYRCAAPGSYCPSPPQPPAGGGCPQLYVLENGQYALVNNLLPQSELTTDTFQMKRDFTPLIGVTVPDSGLFSLRISEDEQELSRFDRVGLVNVLIPRSVERPRISHRSDLVDLTGQFVEPARATTEDGQDITAQLEDLDGSYFTGPGDSGYIDLEYRLAGAAPKGTSTVSLTAADGGIDPPPPPKAVAKIAAGAVGVRVNSYTVQARDGTGAWQTVAVIGPRVRSVAQFVELSDYIVAGLLQIRLKWTGGIQLDHLPFKYCTKPQVTFERLPAVAAVHSELGSVTGRLLRADGLTTSLSPGQHIDLTFRLGPLADSLYRLPVFGIDGSYVHQNSANRPGSGMLPESFCFEQNYPNPFNPGTTFRFSLPDRQLVKLEIFNVLGQKIVTLVDREVEAGQQVYQWNGQVDGQPIASGVYLARLTAGSQSATRKMVVVK